MFQTQVARQRSWAGLGWLAALAIGALIAAANIYVGALVLLVALAGLASVALLPARAARPAAAAKAAARAVALAPVAQRVVYTAEGDERAAIVVPAASADGYRAVLTSAGYHLVNDAGQIVYTLKR